MRRQRQHERLEQQQVDKAALRSHYLALEQRFANDDNESDPTTPLEPAWYTATQLPDTQRRTALQYLTILDLVQVEGWTLVCSFI